MTPTQRKLAEHYLRVAEDTATDLDNYIGTLIRQRDWYRKNADARRAALAAGEIYA